MTGLLMWLMPTALAVVAIAMSALALRLVWSRRRRTEGAAVVAAAVVRARLLPEPKPLPANAVTPPRLRRGGQRAAVLRRPPLEIYPGGES